MAGKLEEDFDGSGRPVEQYIVVLNRRAIGSVKHRLPLFQDRSRVDHVPIFVTYLDTQARHEMVAHEDTVFDQPSEAVER